MLHIKINNLLYLVWLQFLIKYRRTIVGPLWIMISPALFIGGLGFLFSAVGQVPADKFIPHLACGFVLWTLIQGFVTGSTTIFMRNRGSLLQSGVSAQYLIVMDLMMTLVHFLHQVVIVIAVLFIFDVSVSLADVILSMTGLVVILINGYSVAIVLAIVGVRYRDVTEVIQALMRMAFLATPIIWLPNNGERGSVLSAFMLYNPFYHFVEIFRAPLLGNEVMPITWMVVLSITLLGLLVSYLLYKRMHKMIPLWL